MATFSKSGTMGGIDRARARNEARARNRQRAAAGRAAAADVYRDLQKDAATASNSLREKALAATSQEERDAVAYEADLITRTYPAEMLPQDITGGKYGRVASGEDVKRHEGASNEANTSLSNLQGTAESLEGGMFGQLGRASSDVLEGAKGLLKKQEGPKAGDLDFSSSSESFKHGFGKAENLEKKKKKLTREAFFGTAQQSAHMAIKSQGNPEEVFANDQAFSNARQEFFKSATASGLKDQEAEEIWEEFDRDRDTFKATGKAQTGFIVKASDYMQRRLNTMFGIKAGSLEELDSLEESDKSKYNTAMILIADEVNGGDGAGTERYNPVTGFKNVLDVLNKSGHINFVSVNENGNRESAPIGVVPDWVGIWLNQSTSGVPVSYDSVNDLVNWWNEEEGSLVVLNKDAAARDIATKMRLSALMEAESKRTSQDSFDEGKFAPIPGGLEEPFKKKKKKAPNAKRGKSSFAATIFSGNK